MFNYQKTQLGLDALQQRTRDLNARQRRLLLLIGTEDFDFLGNQFKQRLAPPELIEQLLDMQLIAPAVLEQDTLQQQVKAPTPNPLHTEIHSQLASNTPQAHTESLAEPIRTQHLKVNSVPAYLEARVAAAINTTEQAAEQLEPQAEIQPEITALSFEDVKFLMMDTLQRHCGLMAKQLIQRIVQAQDIRSLKLCQMQWITSLQETRLPPKALNQILQQINHSLQKLNPT
ncbi:hypothetical protein KAM398_03460 [Acinetobacter sp. KAM398]|uniref:hypothetical protein n=1 Tax=unclassified Acinetobacter TaxID=196816 RepID=UPI001F35B15A|nr:MULTISPECIES: hypothetical protein [unclassified Acinetobacter]GJC30418.1 hypothetical protein KAM392_03970 [Acinetobacter sp. KAM392]GJC33227.1 hypothetical protein KAM393_03960 [Acinetobacter sp. KAM393]GJC36056.1 hypothetical protein KAM394_03960 [Acinetobacter sp. KAM394]GJC38875.1 hypothetical protein KAM395_03960 [Acinetobacter sp. KAM395]GJC41896.1 hypothetical protein KAM396_05930 [Acinetobacter sp. KAM396]